MEFRTKIVLGSKTATGFQVPDEVVEGLGSGKNPKLRSPSASIPIAVPSPLWEAYSCCRLAQRTGKQRELRRVTK